MLKLLLITEQTNYLGFVQRKIEYIGTEKANAINTIQCPGCHIDYVGKTGKNLITRLSDHGKKEQPMFQNF